MTRAGEGKAEIERAAKDTWIPVKKEAAKYGEQKWRTLAKEKLTAGEGD